MANDRLPFSRDDLGLLLVCAVRYAVGRRTYVPTVVAQSVTAALPLLSANDRSVIARDVGEAFARHDVGDACDAEAWQRLLDTLAADAEVTP